MMLLKNSEAVPMIKNGKKDIDYRLLEPKLGTSYTGLPKFASVLTALNAGQFKAGLKKIDQLIQNPETFIDAVRLKAEVYATFEEHLAAWKQFERILDVEPYDKQALFMTVVLATILEKEATAESRQQVLKERFPQLEKELRGLLEFILMYQQQTDFEDQIDKDISIEVLAVYGFGLNEDGSFPAVLKSRLEKTVEYARNYPWAEIIVSGGAVTTPFNEAVEMKKWLVEQGINEQRILLDPVAKDTVGNSIGITAIVKLKQYQSCCVITSLAHLPRAWMSLVASFKREKMSISVYGAACEKPKSIAVPKSELTLSYHTTFRAAGLFEKKDFEEMNHERTL